MRVLTETEDKYKYNVWDSVKIPEEYTIEAKQKIKKDNEQPKADHSITYDPWEAFYKRYDRSFFKERQWIPKEYPETIVHTNSILEIGCGTGSTLIPLIKSRLDRQNDYLQDTEDSTKKRENSKDKIDSINSTDSQNKTQIKDNQNAIYNETHNKHCSNNKDIIHISENNISKCNNIFGMDYSSTAIQILQSRIPILKNQFTSGDITKITEKLIINGKPLDSIDIILLIYTLSAVHPSSHRSVFELVHRTLKPGGIVIFKDYYEMDLTQLRFKENQVIDRNLYQRGDMTYVYYFSKEEIENRTEGLFSIVKYKEDTKLVLNRKKQTEMYRCFVEMKLEKA